MGIYALLPNDTIKEIPVRILNVKLGGDAGASAITSTDVNRLFAQRRLAKKKPVVIDAPEPKIEPKKQLEPTVEKRSIVDKPEVKKAAKPVETPKAKLASEPVSEAEPTAQGALDKFIPDEPFEAPKPVEPNVKNAQKTSNVVTPDAEAFFKSGMQQQVVESPAPQLKRFMRENQLTAQLSGIDNRQNSNNNDGIAFGNSSNQAAEVQKRYTQTISLWIDRHKVYPEDARARGEGGKVELRIRINRQGRIVRFDLQQSSGSAAIDRAITQMIDAANPLPAVPANFPDSSRFLEFIIPINFIP